MFNGSNQIFRCSDRNKVLSVIMIIVIIYDFLLLLFENGAELDASEPACCFRNIRICTSGMASVKDKTNSRRWHFHSKIGVKLSKVHPNGPHPKSNNLVSLKNFVSLEKK